MSRSDRKARIGFIGAGWWATSNHMPVLAARDDVELAGVCRLGRQELKQIQDRFGFPYATEDYHELLDQCELDGVVVASPHTLHFEHAGAALEKGLHVLCEKPITTRGADARSLVEIADRNGLHLLVPYGWHYKSFVQRAKALLDEGAVGEIEFVLCHMASPIRPLLRGEEFRIDEVSGQSGGNMFDPAPSTWADPKIAGGGYALAQMSHSTGMLFWLSGLQARTVYSVMSSSESAVEMYDALAVSFTNGGIGSMSGAGTVPMDQTFQVDLRFFGSEGMLLLDCERARMHLRRHDGRHEVADVPEDAGFYECDGPPTNFVELILGKTEVNSAPGEAAMRGAEMLDAAYRSAASGKAEPVRE